MYRCELCNRPVYESDGGCDCSLERCKECDKVFVAESGQKVCDECSKQEEEDALT